MSGLDECSLETLRELTDEGGPIAARWCARCDRHYRFCTCDEPAWRMRTGGRLGPLPGEAGGPHTLQEKITGTSQQWPDWNGPSPKGEKT